MKVFTSKEKWEEAINDDSFVIKILEKYNDEVPFEELEEWKQEMLMEICRDWLTALKESL